MIRKVFLIASLLLPALSLVPAAAAMDPVLGGVIPVGLQRGVETEVVFGGARLTDAEQLLFYSPGFEVKKLEVVNDSTVKALIAVSPDCEPGIHAVRVKTATGISDLKTFTVGVLPQVQEKEPNSSFNEPQAIANNVTVLGVVDNEDVDHFVIEAKKGDRITAELEGLRLGYTFFDPYVAILNSERFELSRSDDNALLSQDCLCQIIAPEDGKYIIQVRESSFGGDGNCKYRLHVGDFPRPRAAIPAGGKPGETLQVTWLGDIAGAFNSTVTLPTKLGEARILAQDAKGLAPSPNVFRVADLASANEVEPNDGLPQATAGACPGAMHGVIQAPGDTDFFKFTAKAGEQFDVRCYARGALRSPLDSVVTILNAQGAGVVGNDDSAGPDSYMRFASPADGDYYVVVSDHLKSGGPEYAYRLEFNRVAPALTMALPERQQYVPVTLSVPRGNRMAIMVQGQRANFGGDLNIKYDNLPSGMTVESVPMTASLTDVPVLFTAPAEAASTGSLVDIFGTPVDPNLKVEGHLSQRMMLVRGQNNIDVWGHTADRMAAAITKEIPYSIEIVEPKAPLVRNGQMNLKVVAKRAADFKSPISVFMLYHPPGVSSNGSIVIPEGQTEALIPMTANGGAGIGDWKIAIIGRAGYGNGAVECSSQLATLKISDMFVNLAFQKSAVEQGNATDFVVNVEKKIEFEGNGKIELLGLPAGVTTTPLEFNKDSKELVFKLQVDKTTRPGKYGLLCQATPAVAGEPVVHVIGSGELRVDEPLPPKPAAVAAAPAPTPAAAAPAPAAAPEKRLTRLEQLRLDKEKQKKP
jgi:hypothetical protein